MSADHEIVERSARADAPLDQKLVGARGIAVAPPVVVELDTRVTRRGHASCDSTVQLQTRVLIRGAAAGTAVVDEGVGTAAVVIDPPVHVYRVGVRAAEGARE